MGKNTYVVQPFDLNRPLRRPCNSGTTPRSKRSRVTTISVMIGQLLEPDSEEQLIIQEDTNDEKRGEK